MTLPVAIVLATAIVCATAFTAFVISVVWVSRHRRDGPRA